MDVLIQESRFSFRTTYSISTPTETLSASRTIFSILPKITLFADNAQTGGSPLAIIRRTALFRYRCEIALASGAIWQLQRTNILKGIYTCEGPGPRFDIYEHRKRRTSIFQNDLQVAALSRNLVVIGSGNRYQLQMNSNADLPLLTGITLALNILETAGKDNQAINIDIGRLGPEARPIDETWQPR